MWCHHPDCNNIPGHSLSEALQAASLSMGSLIRDTLFPSLLSQTSLVLSCLSLWFVAQIPSTSLSSAKININSSVWLLVVPHLTLAAILGF